MTEIKINLTSLDKAVAPHPSHFAPRRRDGRFRQGSERAEAPRGATGRFIKRLDSAERKEAARLAGIEQGRFARQMSNHFEDCHSGAISAVKASERGEEAIFEYYERMYRVGMQSAGNPAVILTPRDRAVINRAAQDESDFWKQFMQDVDSRSGTMDYQQRLAMYHRAIGEMYWLGWVYGDIRPKRQIVWKLGESEHCDKCVELSQGERPRRFWDFIRECVSQGFVPQAGSLPCRTNCKCRLVEIQGDSV
jgi:hypothetical protein